MPTNPTISVADAAFWLAIGSSPIVHRRQMKEDPAYREHYWDHPQGAARVEKWHEVTFSWIRCHDITNIIIIKEALDSSGNHTSQTLVSWESFINFAAFNGYATDTWTNE